MRITNLIFKLSRPRFWIYLAGPYLLGYTFAYEHGEPFLNAVFLYSLLFFLIPANIFLYGVNDINDMETDKINPKKNSKEQATQNTTLILYQRSVLISLLLTIPLFFLQDAISNFLTIIFLLLSYYYSAPPFRFKSRPFFDSITNILYGIPALIGVTQLQSHFPPLIVILIILLWTAAMHLYSAIPDIKYDKEAGIQTTAVLLGTNKSLYLCLILWLCMAILSVIISPLLFLAFVYPICAILVLTNRISLIQMYWRFPYITSLLGFLLYLYAYNS
ncbi:prenyltransferase [Candidatus Woesebacteria bacterium]|nr:prenyltransferase [Candidatus Woesebacteria bacterium]